MTEAATKSRRRRRWGVIALVVLVLSFWLRSGSGGLSVAPGSALVIDLGGQYIEAPETPILERLLGARAKPFAALLHLFALAERDQRIDTVVLRIRSLNIGWGKAEELRAAIGRLRSAGRNTVALLELQQMAAHREYYVASAAERVYLIPGGAAPLVGLAAEYLHLGGLFEKLGIDFEVARAGRYKSAVEFFSEKEMSAASREMANALIDSIEDNFVRGIAESRDLRVDEVHAALEAGTILGSELVARGLVDGERHLDDLVEPFGSVVSGADYALIDPASVGFAPVAQYALVYGSGAVVLGEANRRPGGGPVFASDSVSKALLDAAKAPEIDAVILRIDSPGGSALASELVWRAVEEVKKSGKPVIASYSDVAASGGYYASVGADKIVAPAGVLTGSIGVFLLRPEVSGLLSKLDIGVEAIQRGPFAQLQLASRPLSAGARKRLTDVVLDTYRLFVDRVAEGRKMAPAAIDAVAQGRVWTGAQALEVGLVDEIGGLRTAVLAAKRAQGLDPDADVSLVPFPAPMTLAQQLATVLDARIGGALRIRIPLPVELERLTGGLADLPLGTPLLVPPFAIDVH